MWSSTGKIGARGFRSPFAHGEFTAGQWFSVLPLPMANAFLPTQRMQVGMLAGRLPCNTAGSDETVFVARVRLVLTDGGVCQGWAVLSGTVAREEIGEEAAARGRQFRVHEVGESLGRWLSRRSRTTSHRDPTGSCPFVACPVDEPFDPGQHDGARTSCTVQE